MLTIDTATLTPGTHDLWTLQYREFDGAWPEISHLGLDKLDFTLPGRDGAGDLYSHATGLQLYLDSRITPAYLQSLGEKLQTHGDDDYYLLLFADVASLKKGIKEMMATTDSRSFYSELEKALQKV